MARVLLLVPSTSYRVSDFLDAARALDVEVVVGTDREQVLANSEGLPCFDFRDSDRGAEEIRAHAVNHRIDAVVAADEEPLLLGAKAGAALGLPHNDPDAVRIAINKKRLRAVLSQAGLPQPRFQLHGVDDDPTVAAGQASYPCVLKPLSLSASRGVIRADTPAQFVAAFRRISALLGQLDPDRRQPALQEILVETFVPGAEFAVEGLLTAGRLRVLALFDKPDPLDGPYFEETIYVTPSRHPTRVQERLIAAVAEAIAAIGLREGPIHAEVRLHGDTPYVLEVAARSIGGLCGRTLRFGAGISLEELILRHALRLPIEGFERERRPAGVMMIPIPRGGVLRRVDGLLEAQGVEGVVELSITIAREERVVPLPEGNRYLGFIVARGPTAAEVERTLRAAHAKLSFVIE
ncbi:MAG: ATP-grasp domain-containing protein [Alphaproteobacteria bacterium]|nr:ATP-grasp domain-containing protein [Alphaproteobacteria bacterium]